MSYVYSGINEMQMQLITKPEFSVMTQTTMSLGDFDAVEEIVLPPETANAQPYEEA